ncbi:class I SAM-dependent methyltransferase [Cellulosimicrobium arenosum]|uniref:Class I SAM-dependent methyltransferase n=1 Tax=Cellulosimicrobium arenosum TaxID=2708133 RepID=A0A927G7X7_9MICO|nr:class I SAM-dependent methyltransferase [Cellulosimicrobium arenosum]MBD8078557.1 class I SAM-dependent methyltransferase [Cellulosimicrobium arenosum]
MAQHPAHQHTHQHAHQHAHEHGHGQGQPDDQHMADMLDLDALVAGPLLDELTGWAAEHAPATVRDVVDLGAGTGTGTLALARRFPAARITSVDAAPAMLDRLRSATVALGDRVVPLEADLDQGWPVDLAAPDLVWSALALHHVADPVRLLDEIRDRLAPDGLLVLVEMDAPPTYLPHDVGHGRPGLEDRLHDAVDTGGMDPHPDWTDTLEAHGYDVVGCESFAVTTADPSTLARLAHLFLTHVRSRTADDLAADDRATLDLLLGDGPDSVLHRRDLELRASRTVWAARRA